MDNDDEPVGRILTRRQAVALAGLPALTWLAGCSATDGSNGTASTTDSAANSTSTATPSGTAPSAGTMTSASVTASDGTTACVAQPELTEGPYYVDENLRRSDIRTDTGTGDQQEGVQLHLGFKVFELTEDSCTPLESAIVDVWHADAHGVYSDVEAQNTVGKDFLRGIQTTDGNGAASFTTIYPGWYTGRAVHIHFKIRSSEDATDAYEFTSQLFFDDDLTDQLYTHEPYSERGERDTRNSEDSIFAQGNAEQLILDLSETGDGYGGTLNVALYTDEESYAGEMDDGMGGSAPPEGSAPPNGSMPQNGTPPNGSAPPTGSRPDSRSVPSNETNETNEASVR